MDNLKVVTNSKPTSNEPKVITQREAVYLEVIKVIKQEKIVVGPKQQVQALLNEKHLIVIVKNLCSNFKNGSISFKPTESNKKKLAEQKLLEKYTIGLVNNWLRRDERLNGTANKVQ